MGDQRKVGRKEEGTSELSAKGGERSTDLEKDLLTGSKKDWGGREKKKHKAAKKLKKDEGPPLSEGSGERRKQRRARPEVWRRRKGMKSRERVYSWGKFSEHLEKEGERQESRGKTHTGG